MSTTSSTAIITIAPPPPRDWTADETTVYVRELLSFELLALRDLRRTDVLIPEWDDCESDDVARAIAHVQLAVIEREIERRDRASRIEAGIASPTDIKYVAWADVAGSIRDTISVPDILHHLGWPTKRTGRDREGREEVHCACPFCGGEDRFIAWGLPRSRWMCRHCSEGRAEDVITLWRNVHGGLGFRATCEALAALAGVTA